MTKQLSIEGSHFTQLANYRSLQSKGKDPKTYISKTQEGDKKRF